MQGLVGSAREGSAVNKAAARGRDTVEGPNEVSGFAAITTLSSSSIERQTSRFLLPSSGNSDISKPTVPPALLWDPFQASTIPGPRASGCRRSGAEHSEASVPGPMVTKGVQLQPVTTGPTGGSSSSSPSSLGGCLGSSFGDSSSQPVQVTDPAMLAWLQSGVASARVICPVAADTLGTTIALIASTTIGIPLRTALPIGRTYPETAWFTNRPRPRRAAGAAGAYRPAPSARGRRRGRRG